MPFSLTWFAVFPFMNKQVMSWNVVEEELEEKELDFQYEKLYRADEKGEKNYISLLTTFANATILFEITVRMTINQLQLSSHCDRAFAWISWI